MWFGLELTGTAALATAPLHWTLFALGAWAFWTARPWIWPASMAYALYVAASHLVWNLTSASGGGTFTGAAIGGDGELLLTGQLESVQSEKILVQLREASDARA